MMEKNLLWWAIDSSLAVDSKCNMTMELFSSNLYLGYCFPSANEIVARYSTLTVSLATSTIA